VLEEHETAAYKHIVLQAQIYSSTSVYRTAGAAASTKAPTAVPTVKRRVTTVGNAPLVVDCPGVMTRPFSSVAAAVGTGVASGVAATVGAGVGTVCLVDCVQQRSLRACLSVLQFTEHKQYMQSMHYALLYYCCAYLHVKALEHAG
jgi:hypothetical protein